MERILIVHNRYQHRGGEDSVAEAEMDLLREHGHEVEFFEKSYADLEAMPKWRVALDAVWSRRTVSELSAVIERFKPHVVHFHNTFPLISAGAYWEVAKHGIPAIQTLHNFRWVCPGALLFRNGKACEDCVGRFPWRGVVHGCYRNSRIQTAASLVALAFHRAIRTMQSKVTLFLPGNKFCEDVFLRGGLPASKMRIKPNFLSAKSIPSPTGRQGGLFVGRLSKEKGLDVLAAAVKKVGNNKICVIGGGDLESMARETFGENYLGFHSLESIAEKMHAASYLIVTSKWYENFPRTIVEALSCGLPIIGSNLGAMSEIIKDGYNGLHFKTGDADDLAEKIQWAETHPEEMQRLSQNAWQDYLEHYTPERNYEMLVAAYREAIQIKQDESEAA